MSTKEELQKRLDEINKEINSLHDEGMKIVGKIELLNEKEGK